MTDDRTDPPAQEPAQEPRQPDEARPDEGQRSSRRLRLPTVAALLAVPVVIAGLYWLLIHGQFTITAIVLAVAVLAMLTATVWEFRHGHPVWAVILLVGALGTVSTVGWYGYHLNAKLGGIDRADDGSLSKGERPDDKGPKEALNILLMGADNPTPEIEKPSIAELLADGEWDVGAYRSDTVMVLHISADRKSAAVVSVPRDSFVPIFDSEGTEGGENKVNAAFSLDGPFGTWRTVENLSGLRLDHMAIIDFEGFRDLTEAIGGVDVYLPEEVEDPKQDITWPQGWNHIEGDRALKYVRQRYNLDEGDFDRVDRQQNFLRAVMSKVLDSKTIGDPTKFPQTLEAITNNLTVDESFSNGDIRSLALGLRGLDPDKVTFVTLPLGSYDDVPGIGSIVRIDEQKATELWEAVGSDRLDRYLKKYPDDELPDPKDVD